MPTAVQGEYDAMLIHRPLYVTYPDMVKRFQAAGAMVICDEDDDLTRIHETKNEIGLMEWVPRAVQAHDIAVTIADGVTVSTEPLKAVYEKLNPNVTVCRNALPAEYLAIRSYLEDDVIRVGWAGITQTHQHDLEWIAPSFEALIRGATFSTIGDGKTPQMLGYYGGPREITEFVASPRELYQTMARADVAFVPLLPCGFNEGKSWLKALEYMTVGVPCVVTDLPEQRLLIDHGVNGFLADTPAHMAGYVQLLVNDPELRHDMARAAKERAAELVIEETAGVWEDAIG
jgi:glycosyltransferase involved in cell wall biosynthesis